MLVVLPQVCLILTLLLTPSVVTAQVSSRINGGQTASAGRYPYSVSLQGTEELSHFCGGSLIAPDVVLSAAHCLFRPVNQVAARIRPFSLRKPRADSEILPILEAIVHPKYQDAAVERIGVPSNDVLLLRLNGTSNAPYIRINQDNAFPIDGQSLTQMGFGDLANRQGIFPDRLQTLDTAVYYDNEHCKETVLARYPSSSFPMELKDDMLCTLEAHGEGVCNGDSGGPLVAKGVVAAEDVLVGVTSWGSSCSNQYSASVFVRISSFYDFIREIVCRVSISPPNYFGCTRFPEPDIPSIPSIPPPTGPCVTVQLFLGFAPRNLGWRLQLLNGTVVHEVSRGSYPVHYAEIVEQVQITPDEFYDLVVYSGGRGGLDEDVLMAASVYYGRSVDERLILAAAPPSDLIETTFIASLEETIPLEWLFNSSFPTVAPSESFEPTTGSLIEVSISIRFDTYPVETSWTLEKIATDRRIAEGGPYSPFVDRRITETVVLEEHVDYVFTIFDSTGTGICCFYGNGEARIYIDSSDQLLAYDDGQFEYSRVHTFSAARNETFRLTSAPSVAVTDSPAPSSSPAPSGSPQLLTVTAKIGRDFSGYLSWAVLDEPGGRILNESRGYRFNRRIFDNSTIELQFGHEYVLEAYNWWGDGLCCGDFIAVSLGPVFDESHILAYVTDNFGSLSSQRFLLSPQGTIVVTSAPTVVESMSPSSEPSQSKTPSLLPTRVPSVAPSLSLYPSGIQALISIQVMLPNLPLRSIGLALQREYTTKRRVIYENSALAFNSRGGLVSWASTVEVDYGMEYLVTLTDSQGLCCESGTVKVYLGTDLVEENLLLSFQGQSGFQRSDRFLASEEGLLNTRSPSASPSESPSVSPSKPASTSPSEVASVTPTESASLPTTTKSPLTSPRPVTSIVSPVPTSILTTDPASIPPVTVLPSTIIMATDTPSVASEPVPKTLTPSHTQSSTPVEVTSNTPSLTTTTSTTAASTTATTTTTTTTTTPTAMPTKSATNLPAVTIVSVTSSPTTQSSATTTSLNSTVLLVLVIPMLYLL